MALRDEMMDATITIRNTTICGETTENLFSNNATVSAMCLVDYLDWACCPVKYEKILALPPIQRGSVWKPKQIADLWDSLLRKMPVGSFMLSRLGKKMHVLQSRLFLSGLWRLKGKWASICWMVNRER